MMEEKNKDNLSEESTGTEKKEYAYKSILNGTKNSRIYSLISIASAVISLIFSFVNLPWVALIFGALGIVFAVISRKNLGYFDNISIWGLIIGIFGIVFSLTSFILSAALSENDGFKSFMESLLGKKN